MSCTSRAATMATVLMAATATAAAVSSTMTPGVQGDGADGPGRCNTRRMRIRGFAGTPAPRGVEVQATYPSYAACRNLDALRGRRRRATCEQRAAHANSGVKPIRAGVESARGRCGRRFDLVGV